MDLQISEATYHLMPKVDENPHQADRVLAEKIIAGDEASFRKLYDENASSLLRRLLRLTGDPNQAEDCLQHVFTEALKTLKNYRGEGSLSAWLSRICTFTVLDLYRKKQRWRSFMDGLWPAQKMREKIDAPPLPESLFLQKELRQIVRDILEKLSPRKKMALLLCDLEGLGIEEAAQQMNVPAGTVASRLHHGRLDFRKLAKAEFNRHGISTGEWFHE